jgi:hypothetical protein
VMLTPATFVAFGLLAAGVARHRGRSLIAWIVIGLLTGPLALIGAIVLPHKMTP